LVEKSGFLNNIYTHHAPQLTDLAARGEIQLQLLQLKKLNMNNCQRVNKFGSDFARKFPRTRLIDYEAAR
jgi:hypothetical protein